MAASPVLADSSYYISLLRQRQDPVRHLALAAETRDLAVCGVVRCEVGRALRPERIRKQFREVWDVMINVPCDNRLWADVEDTLWQLDRRGMIVPLTDAVIACCARRIGALVLTFDEHFQTIPGVKAIDSLEA
jgi:predicted nucleic acid-binding protein